MRCDATFDGCADAAAIAADNFTDAYARANDENADDHAAVAADANANAYAEGEDDNEEIQG